MIELNKIYNEDCVIGMKNIKDNTIDLIITSPPYFLNKEYENTWTYDYYCKLLSDVFYQAQRILKIGAYFVVNFGDYYNSGNRFYDADVPSVYPAAINFFNWGINNNFDLQATRIWRKQFGKMSIPFICNSHPRNVFDYEHIWTFRKKGTTDEYVNDRKLSQCGVIGETWKSPARIDEHCAAFPIELPTWAMLVYSKRGDVVLDPFMGGGTTSIAAIRERRKFIGFEINNKFFKLACERIQLESSQLTIDFGE